MSGWLVNDQLTCIPNTKTFWHFLLDIIPNLVDKTNDYTNFNQLADQIEKQLQSETPKFIIRNATYFRQINTDVYTISLLQDNQTKHKKWLEQQITVLNNSNTIICNSRYMVNKYQSYIKDKNKIKIIPLGTDFKIFKPLSIDNHYNILPNSIIFIGSSRKYPKGFDRVIKIIDNLPDFNFCLVLKDKSGLEQIPVKNRHRVRIFNRIGQSDVANIINLCQLGICTSYEETQHLSGIEIMGCNKPMVATNVGFYYDNQHSEQWGVIANDSTFISQIRYVRDNLDKFRPREYVIENGYSTESCRNSWQELVHHIS